CVELVVVCAVEVTAVKHTAIATITNRIVVRDMSISFSMQRVVVDRTLVGPGQHGADDEAPRGRTDVVEGIAGDQRQCARGRRVEHRDVVGANDPGSLDAIEYLYL